ncbi:MAG: hypothetical protein EPN85_01025 [Bacteroidetes bacterium]|nr:MAG: hypothetical protein EPN85_01025 [Bacteroidota bacterium]
MKTKISILLFAIISTIVFDSCLKKGEDDSSISLRSRKARVTGDWKVTSYTYTDSYTSLGDIYTSDFDMNGSTYISTYTDPIGTTIDNGAMTWEWNFKKDGTYKSTSTDDGDVSTEDGTWNFTTGIGDLKNKSQITYWGKNYTSSGGTSSYTGHYVDIAYDLIELREKKMVWNYEYTYSDSSSSGSYKEEIVFEKK